MSKKQKIYKEHLIAGLKELSDKSYQNDIWLNQNNPNQWWGSFIEAANTLFDDAGVTDALEANFVIYDEKVTQALRQLDVAVAAVDEFRPEEEIINDPLMEEVRQKAAHALFLINVSTGEGSTVDIAVPGQSEPAK